MKDKKYCKIRDHCNYTGEYRGDTLIMCNLKYNVPKNISKTFHNRSYYDYHFLIKKLAEEIKN